MMVIVANHITLTLSVLKGLLNSHSEQCCQEKTVTLCQFFGILTLVEFVFVLGYFHYCFVKGWVCLFCVISHCL